jgi:hypothetical protein
MNYAAAKLVKWRLELEVALASKAFRAIAGIGSGPMGLTPDAIKFSPDYRLAKVRFDVAFAALRDFNGEFHKTFAAEIKAERRERDRSPA